MRKLLQAYFALAFILLSPKPLHAQEYFGEFIDPLEVTINPAATPRPTIRLKGDFRFKDPNGLLWTAPAGLEADGASIPQFFWSYIGGPFEGPYVSASVIHDHYCKTKERTAHDTHRNFYYGMRAANVEPWRAKLMHWAVDTFGPSWKLEKRIVIQQICAPANNQGLVCNSVPTEKSQLVDSPGVDLSDPIVLAAAIGKINAVARTLKTSNGEVLDVTMAGSVTATPQNITSSSAQYRALFISKDFTKSYARLGLLSQSSGPIGAVEPWPGNRIPKLADALILNSRNVQRIDQNLPYKLDASSKDLLPGRLNLKSLESVSRIDRTNRD